MKRTFYLSEKVIGKLYGLTSTEIVQLIFPESDVQAHIADKLFSMVPFQKEMVHIAIFNLYEGLDTDHQYMFDKWFNAEATIFEKKTTPYTGSYAEVDEAQVLHDRLQSGRNYLMEIEPKKFDASDALEAFGWNRNGFNIY